MNGVLSNTNQCSHCKIVENKSGLSLKSLYHVTVTVIPVFE